MGATTEVEKDKLTEAIQYEQAIADEAAEIRGNAAELTPGLLMKLWPLLRRPIPEAFIVTTGAVTGKPYESTGVKSVQVLTDRMDAVLTPCWWSEEIRYFGEDDYTRGGNLCEVTVNVGNHPATPMFSRTSRGGVNQASTLGNRYKGSYTNAAKRAFASVGPGHEIYLGAADLDPDTNSSVAELQARASSSQATRPAVVPTHVERCVGMAMDAVERGLVAKGDLMLKLVAAGATDTASVTRALVSMPQAAVDEIASSLADALAADDETRAARGGEGGDA